MASWGPSHPQTVRLSFSPSGSRVTYPIQVYKTPPADGSRAAPGPQASSSQLSASVPKSFLSKQSGRSTRPQPAGWKKSPEASARPAPFAEPQK